METQSQSHPLSTQSKKNYKYSPHSEKGKGKVLSTIANFPLLFCKPNLVKCPTKLLFGSYIDFQGWTFHGWLRTLYILLRFRIKNFSIRWLLRCHSSVVVLILWLFSPVIVTVMIVLWCSVQDFNAKPFLFWPWIYFSRPLQTPC